MSGTFWTHDEHQFLVDSAREGLTAVQIGELLNRGSNSVRERARRHGIELPIDIVRVARKDIGGVMHKQCTACHVYKPEDTDHFYYNNYRESWEGKCKPCRNKAKARSTKTRREGIRLQSNPEFTATPGPYNYYMNMTGALHERQASDGTPEDLEGTGERSSYELRAIA